MPAFRTISAIFAVFGLTNIAVGQSSTSRTYGSDVAPVIKQNCLPCHLEENENPSGLSMDNYESLMKGGKEGSTVVPGKPQESNLYLKLLSDPPFGKQMPRNRKKLSAEDVKIIYDWILQGAKKD